MHLFCTGSGNTTVVLQHGWAANSLDWTHIYPILAEKSQVCILDRSGYGWSDLSANPRDGFTMSNELQQVLNTSGVSNPLIMVGHSLGGVLASIYAGRFPQSIKGLILLDPPYPGRYECGPNIKAPIEPRGQFFRMTCGWGTMRLLYSLGYFGRDITAVPDQLPENISSLYQQKLFKCNMFEAMHREAMMWPKTCFQAPKYLGDLNSLVFISGNGYNHTEWSTISSRTKSFNYPLADHSLHVDPLYYRNITSEIIREFGL